ncbi:MAG: FAD binding domain-containing protein [Burkholderiales bacterium]|jgi:carbon-monoxide dehydrogenase medium subunit
MKAAPFAWQRPADLPAALQALQAQGSSAVGGGQSLGPMLNLRLARPDALIDLRRLPELRGATVQAGVLRLGAAVTHAEIEDGLVPDTTGGMLPSVARGIAYRAVRNRGTVGGSLCHADPAADWVNALMALGATVCLEGPQGARRLPLEDFIVAGYATALQPGEVLVAIELPAFGPGLRWGYHKLCPKVGEFADAIGVVVIDPGIGHCRVLVGAIETRPALLPDAPGLLQAAAQQSDPHALFSAAVTQACPGADAVFIHQHAVALTRALAQMNARQP